MKNQQFFITEESLSRAKKQLKKELNNKGIELSLSQSANLIAKSFGFNDEHEMQSFIKNQYKKLNYIDDLSFYHNVTKEEEDYFYRIIEIWSNASVYIKDNISNIMKNTENLENEEAIQTIKSINQVIDTAEYMIKNRKSILHGNLYLGENRVDLFSMAITRHKMLLLSELTSDNNYKTFYNLMDNYHNIEKYFYLSHEMRKDFWLQPKDFKSECSYVRQQNSFYGNIENKELLSLKGNIIIFGNAGRGRNMYAKSLIQSMLIEGNEDISKVKIIDICDYAHLPENKERYFIEERRSEIKYIYTAVASNIEELNEKIMEQNTNYNLYDIQYFIDVNHNQPKVILNESFDIKLPQKNRYRRT